MLLLIIGGDELEEDILELVGREALDGEEDPFVEQLGPGVLEGRLGLEFLGAARGRGGDAGGSADAAPAVAPAVPRLCEPDLLFLALGVLVGQALLQILVVVLDLVGVELPLGLQGVQRVLQSGKNEIIILNMNEETS